MPPAHASNGMFHVTVDLDAKTLDRTSQSGYEHAVLDRSAWSVLQKIRGERVTLVSWPFRRPTKHGGGVSFLE